jgi:hypothetical protein
MELSSKLLALYNEHINDVNVPAHAIVSFRNFLNQSFRLGIRAGSRSIEANTTSQNDKPKGNIWNGLPLEGQPGFEGIQKKTEFKQQPVQHVKTESVIEPQSDVIELTEKQIEAEIEKLGGTFHHKAGLKAKKKILANLQSAGELPS